MYEAGSVFSGLGPVGEAVTVTPARPRASIRAVRPKALGSWIWEFFRVGWASAAIVPESVIAVPSGDVETWMSVVPPASTVWTLEVTWYGATCGRQLSWAG